MDLLNKIVSIHDPRLAHLYGKNKWKIIKIIDSENVQVINLIENIEIKFTSGFCIKHLPSVKLITTSNINNILQIFLNEKSNELLYKIFSIDGFVRDISSFLKSYTTQVETRFLKCNNQWVIPNKSRNMPKNFFHNNNNNTTIWYWNGIREGWLCKNYPDERYNHYIEYAT